MRLRPPGWYRLTVGLGKTMIAALGVRVRIDGEEHIPRTGPVILAVNHVSYADFVPVAQAAWRRGRQVRFFVRHDAWDAPGVRSVLTRMRHVPVDRAAPAAAYLQARSLLRRGELVGNFPEAGISYSLTVRSLMRGPAALARDTGAVVVPVAVWGTQRIYGVGRPEDSTANRLNLTRGRVVDLLCGPPLRVHDGDDLATWTRSLGHVLTELLEELQRKPEHRPSLGEYAPWYPAHLGGDAPDRREAWSFDVVPKAALPPTWGPMVDRPPLG
ncbi:MAG: lysophospholipid acyltransferase family protein [Nocardioides sp.]